MFLLPAKSGRWSQEHCLSCKFKAQRNGPPCSGFLCVDELLTWSEKTGSAESVVQELAKRYKLKRMGELTEGCAGEVFLLGRRIYRTEQDRGSNKNLEGLGPAICAIQPKNPCISNSQDFHLPRGRSNVMPNIQNFFVGQPRLAREGLHLRINCVNTSKS